METLKKIILENLDCIYAILVLGAFAFLFSLPLKVSMIVSSVILVPLFFLMIVLKRRGLLARRSRFKEMLKLFRRGKREEVEQ